MSERHVCRSRLRKRVTFFGVVELDGPPILVALCWLTLWLSFLSGALHFVAFAITGRWP